MAIDRDDQTVVTPGPAAELVVSGYLGETTARRVFEKRVHGAKLLLSVGTAVTLAIGMLAAGPTSVGLGTAGSFAVLAGTTVTNTGSTIITGDLGVNPGSAVTGFPPGKVTGTNQPLASIVLKAKNDLVTAYDAAFGKGPVTSTTHLLGGQKLVAGVYNAGGSTLDLTGTLTLDGQNDPASVWIFQATSDLIVAGSVKLINGASECNVFWQVHSSATLGSGSTFMGTILALTSITMANGVTLNGRALARNGNVTLIGDTITNTCSTSSGAPGAPGAGASASAGASGVGSTATLSTTTTLSDSPSDNSTTPLLPLLIFGFAGMGLAAFVVRQRSIRS
jgi:hypothetical protein